MRWWEEEEELPKAKRLRRSYHLELNQMIGRVDHERHDLGTKKLPASRINCFDRTSILTFGGMLCGDTEFVRGFAKRATRLGGVFGYEKLNIFGGQYIGSIGATQILEYNSGCELSCENYGVAAYDFVQNYIYPMLVDQEGRKLDLFTAKKHFRNLNVLASSFGSIVIEEIGNAICDEMQVLGYSSAEIDEVTNQVQVVIVGPVAQIGKGKANFRRLTIANLFDKGLENDPMQGDWYPSKVGNNSFHLNRIINIAERGGAEISIIQASAREVVIALNANLSPQDKLDRNGNFFEFVDGQHKPTYHLADGNNHDTDLCLIPGLDKYGLFVPSLISNFFSAAVDNSVLNSNSSEEYFELPPVEKMLADMTSRSRDATTITRGLLTAYARQDGGKLFTERLQAALVQPLGITK